MFDNAAPARLVLALGLFLASGAPGCTVETSGAPPPVAPLPPPGRLTVRWTVDEVADPNVCIMGQASSIDIVVTTTGGQLAGEFAASCTTFVTTISTLDPGTYFGTARLVDGDGQPRTTPVNLESFTIIESSELVVDVDFPADSFH